MPGAFLVSAKDRQGDPVTMIIGPHSMSVFTLSSDSPSNTSSSSSSLGAKRWSGWDANRDNRLSRIEFDQGFKEKRYFQKWDVDGDGRLARTEFNTAQKKRPGMFEKRFGANQFPIWDVNNDGYLTEQEWNDGIYAGYDRNNDNYLDEPELRDVGDDIGDGGLFDV